MKLVSRIWLRIAVSVCVALVVSSVALVSRFQNYRINKIQSIIWDNQHENVAHLSREQFTDYLAACGARVDSTAPQWAVHYDGLFRHRAWSFPFAPPRTDSQ